MANCAGGHGFAGSAAAGFGMPNGFPNAGGHSGIIGWPSLPGCVGIQGCTECPAAGFGSQLGILAGQPPASGERIGSGGADGDMDSFGVATSLAAGESGAASDVSPPAVGEVGEECSCQDDGLQDAHHSPKLWQE
mmetsp:Transcript_54891/g.166810  ORF Transcript_54891/g.166810 Transcript_54891/m.166810 type:complete len:135 (-) Transcript_54891:1166-1570(-)